MTELRPRVSHHILSQLEGETVRVILKDGTSLEGIVRRVDERELRLSDQAVLLAEIATYFILKEGKKP